MCLDPQELELLMVVSNLTWLLETEFRPSARRISTLT